MKSEIVSRIIEFIKSIIQKFTKQETTSNKKSVSKRSTKKRNDMWLIKKYEGFSSKPYLCPAGVATIGYGTTHYSNGTKVTMQDKPISKEEADALLLHYVINEIEPYIRDLSLTDNQREALQSLIYNIGAQAFLKSKCYKAIKNGDMCTAYVEWDWIKAGGKVLPGLIKRRAEEKYLFFCEI